MSRSVYQGFLPRRMVLLLVMISMFVFFTKLELHADGKPASTALSQTIKIDAQGGGRIFDGVGAISSSSSLLLYDYPEPQRSQILDYLFKPNYGASLHILKIEIGSDTNSTTSTEPSHMRTPQDLNCHRGIEWWLMKEAKARNPEVKLYGLAWGAPGWLKGGVWTDDQVQYLKTWMGCAQANGFHIDYLGGTNETYTPPPRASFFIALHKMLAANYPDTKIVATDSHAPPDYWRYASEMRHNPAYLASVDILGEHDVCHWRSLYKHCDTSQDARATGKPLWNNEQSSQDAAGGPGPLARAMNRNYIDAQITGNLNWALIASYYGNTATGGQGLMIAETPWSGYYDVTKSIWVDAHTTQFVKPGWRYIDSASGYLTNDASYVTLRSPKSGDYTVVIETMDATTLEKVKFVPSVGLSMGPVSIWSTDIGSDKPSDWFVLDRTQPSGRDGVELVLEPHHIYTLSTTTGQHKGSAAPAIASSADSGPNEQGWLSLPFKQDFEHVDATHRAPYFQDVAGAFETGTCGEGRTGTCYHQVITQQPYLWHDAGKTPGTLAGDPTWWGDYEVSVDAMLEEAGWFEVFGRVEQYNPDAISGYHFRVSSVGNWELYTEGTKAPAAGANPGAGKNVVKLASGTTSFGVNRWHRLGLRFEGNHIVPSIDGHSLANLTDDSHRTGQFGFMVSPWKRAELDNVSVIRTRSWPRFVPHAVMTATATSSQPGVYQHRIYSANEAINGRLETRWSSQFNPVLPLPQTITLDLGRSYKTYGLVADSGRGSVITEYAVAISDDGKNFREVAHGHWDDNTATKIASWPGGFDARFVRLQATATSGDGAGAAELNVAVTPLE